ncbi:MAG: radical SAM protein, partial [Bacteroidales bacterium]|nr:radical SAM protein [Bacteroidales bacterium]
ERFFRLWEDPRLCRHLHLPLQSGSALILKRMARKTTPESYARILSMARAAAPEMAVTTDIITGFPGETEEEFQASLDFVREMRFAGGHVFAYSARPGTAAARLPGAVEGKTSRSRSAAVRVLLEESAVEYRERFTGEVEPVLWEATDKLEATGWRLHGLTGNYLKVTAHSPEHLWNKITPVRLKSLNGDGFEGEILTSQG